MNLPCSLPSFYEDPEAVKQALAIAFLFFTVYAYLREPNRERRPGRITSRLVQEVEGR